MMKNDMGYELIFSGNRYAAIKQYGVYISIYNNENGYDMSSEIWESGVIKYAYRITEEEYELRKQVWEIYGNEEL